MQEREGGLCGRKRRTQLRQDKKKKKYIHVRGEKGKGNFVASKSSQVHEEGKKTQEELEKSIIKGLE